MTEPTPPAVLLADTKPETGCTSCGSQNTVQLHPHTGRECPDHITLPPGAYRPDLAADMVAYGRADRAFTYLAAYLARTAGERFDRSAAALRGSH